MQKKLKFSTVVVVVLLLGVLAADVTMGTRSMDNVESVYVDPELPKDIAEDLSKLKEMTPETIEEVEAEIIRSANRFLMWTHNGIHIMWGRYFKGRFTGTDNLNKRCWGIYGKGVFAGFYNGEFFWGRYENGTWKSKYLFGVEHAHGRYVLFPGITTEPVENLP